MGIPPYMVGKVPLRRVIRHGGGGVSRMPRPTGYGLWYRGGGIIRHGGFWIAASCADLLRVDSLAKTGDYPTRRGRAIASGRAR